MGLPIDITGQKFNRLTAIKYQGKTNNNTMMLWLFKCDCGNEKIIRKTNVVNGVTKSCGCLQKETVSAAVKKRVTVHGMSKTHIFMVYNTIRSRCYNKNNNNYHLYGGAGVTMCKEWLDNFILFHDWCIKNGWRKGLQVDKDILCDKLNISPAMYSPDTCTIVTSKVNSNNTSRNRRLEYEGENRTLAEWEAVTGINQTTILARLKYGWSVKDTLTISSQKTGKQKCFH